MNIIIIDDDDDDDELSRRNDGSLITGVFFCVKIVQSWSHKSVHTRHTGL